MRSNQDGWNFRVDDLFNPHLAEGHCTDNHAIDDSISHQVLHRVTGATTRFSDEQHTFIT